MSEYHTPVLIQEVLEFLRVQPKKIYIDATLGGGGHTIEILKRGGRVLGLDVDQEALDYVKGKIKSKNEKLKIWERLILVRGSFRDIEELAKEQQFENVDGVLFDLGVSSHQLDTPQRGFSFVHAGPLDMRMDERFGVTAKDLINVLSKKELYELFTKLGEERFAWVICNSIIRARRVKPIATTSELAHIIEQAVGSHRGDIHPATRVFQALRIAVNSELENIQLGLAGGLHILEKGGRILVISFHSLEDRIVKETFKRLEEEGKGRILTKKPVEATDLEKEQNIRSRSAKLRVIEKL